MQSRGKGASRGKRQGREEETAVDRIVTRMTVKDFRSAVQDGIFQQVILESDWTTFKVIGRMEGGVAAELCRVKGNSCRVYRNPATALADLRKMGVVRVEVLMKEWDVELAVVAMRQRPDVTARRLRTRRTPSMERKLDMGPVNREEERWLRFNEKLDEEERVAATARPPAPRKSREEEQREIEEDRRWSDQMTDEVYRMAVAAREAAAKARS